MINKSKTNEKKHLAIFVPTLNGGGAERVMVTLANGISKRGFSVDLLVAKKQGPYLENVASSVNLVDLKAGKIINSLFPLIHYLRHNNPQALLSAMGHANVIALLAQKISRVSTHVVVSERGFISGEYALNKSLISKINYWLIKLLYPKSDAVCTVSFAAAKDLSEFTRMPLEKIHTLYNPFDLKLITKLSAEPLNHPWFETDQPPVVLAIGRLNEAKDFSVLIHAFAKVRKHITARLIILGEGDLRKELENLILKLDLGSDAIQLPGFVKNPFSWLSRCNLFVLSSRREGLPGVLIEAMACGAPIVSTNCLSGPEEILEGGIWGQLVPVGNIDSLAKAIINSLNTPKSNQPDVRKRAEDFAQDRAIDAYLKLLKLH